MRYKVQQVPVTILQGVSGAMTPTQAIDFTPNQIAPGANTFQAQLALQFPNGFVDTDPIAGMYNPRFYAENLPQQTGYDWEYLLSVSPSATLPQTALVGSTPIPRDRTTLENFIKATYFNAGSEILGYMQMQLQVASGSAAYDTDRSDAMDPVLIFEFDRQNPSQLSADFPVGESDHLWLFSQADLYVDIPAQNGWGTQRFLLGWIADEDLEFSDYQNMVKFQKGKPKATAVQFMSEIVADIKGQIATADPWLMEQMSRQQATVVNNELQFSEVNTQRVIPTYQFSLEFQSSAGHWRRIIMPKAQIDCTAAIKPGANEISKAAFTITPWVTANRTVVYQTISKSQIQRIGLPFTYHVS